MEENNDTKVPFDEALLFNRQPLLNGKIHDQRPNDWTEEIFIGRNPQGNELSNNYIGLCLKPRRVNWFLIILIMSVGALLLQTFILQVLRGDEYWQLAEKNRIRVYYEPAPRGIIYDRNGVPLVKNIPDFALFITPVDFPKATSEREAILAGLVTKYPELSLKDRLDKILKITSNRKEYYQPNVLINNVDYDNALRLKLETSAVPGMSVDIENRRQYLFTGADDGSLLGPSLAHLLGYVGKVNDQEFKDYELFGYLFNDMIGKAGIEKIYERALRGEYGRRQVEVDSMGKEKKIIAQEAAVDGSHVYLAVDIRMQEKLESLIQNTLAKTNLKRAVAIVEDPRNGEILAMVSLPSYDSNAFGKGISAADYKVLLENPDQPLFNRAISGEYPSGSTIKPVVAAAALQEGIISAGTSFVSSGGIRINEWFFPDWKAGGHGITDVRKAIAQSVNTFFYIIGGGYGDFTGLGPKKLKEYMEKFGLNNKTGIDLPGERVGFVPDPEWKWATKNEQWYIGDTYHVSIGQGDLLVTPLQVANYIAAVANGGTLYRPHLAKKIVDPAVQKDSDILPEVLNSNFVDPKNIQIVREGMRQTVVSGSARSLSNLPIAVAGKTGTAQWGTDKANHAWFTSFAPYENPEISVTILIEEGIEGSTVAVPIARDFYQWWATQIRNKN